MIEIKEYKQDTDFLELLDGITCKESTRARNANNNLSTEDIITLSNIHQLGYDGAVQLIRSILNRSESKLTTPLLVRKAVYFIAYRECYKGRESVQKQLLQDLGIGHNSFSKWGMSPAKDYSLDNYSPPSINIYRNGKKRDTLRFLITSLVHNSEYKIFVDVFGGTGAVLTGLARVRGTREIINDSDPVIANFLKVISKNPQKLYETCKSLIENVKLDEEILMEAQEILSKRKEYQEKKVEREIIPHLAEGSESIQKKFKKLESIIEEIGLLLPKIDLALHSRKGYNSMFTEEKELIFCLGIYKKIENILKEYKENKKLGDVKVASIFYFLSSFKSGNRSSSYSISGVTYKNIRAYKDNLDKIIAYGTRMKKVEVRCQDFRELIEEHKDKEDTVLYLDPPYYLTTQYEKEFDDEMHKKMMDLLKDSKCKWIMSCKDKETNRSLVKKNENRKWKSLIEYFNDFKGNTKGSPKFVYREDEQYLGKNQSRSAEVVITNFEATPANNQAYKIVYKNFKNANENGYDFNKDGGYLKETYDEFLERIANNI